MDSLNIEELAFYLTPEHECSYLPGESAMTLFADPHRVIDTDLYSKLIQFGFRRSGQHVYRPRCPLCDKCIPVRIVTADFRANRSQRRNWRDNADLDIAVVSPTKTPTITLTEHTAKPIAAVLAPILIFLMLFLQV